MLLRPSSDLRGFSERLKKLMSVPGRIMEGFTKIRIYTPNSFCVRVIFMEDARNALFYFDVLQLHYSKLELRQKVSLK